jgi:glycosyltransferase involved in cell wall biosynthesis
MEIPFFFGSVLVNLYRKTLGRRVMSGADKVIVTTGSYAQTSRDLWNLKDVNVIPNAIDTQRFNPSISGDAVREKYDLVNENVVLYVGRLVHHKGLEQFIISAENTPENTKYLIVGEGPLKKDLEDLIIDRKLGEKVILAGRIPNETLPEYYAACDVFVLPSVSRLEAFGVVALEAMGCGKPVIVSDMPGVRELITDGKEGFIAKPLSSDDLADKIQRIVDNKDMARRMSIEVRKKVETKFSWKNIVNQVEAVYASSIK